MTPERARELQRLASQWPYWGNLTRFMTPDESAEIDLLWLEASASNGNLSRASIVNRIAHDRDPLTGEPRP